MPPALPIGIVEASVSAKLSDKLNEPLDEIERETHRGDDASAAVLEVEKQIIEESVSHCAEITSGYEKGLVPHETSPSAVAEHESAAIELIAERGLQETEQL